jgi:hypothetical protein
MTNAAATATAVVVAGAQVAKRQARNTFALRFAVNRGFQGQRVFSEALRGWQNLASLTANSFQTDLQLLVALADSEGCGQERETGASKHARDILEDHALCFWLSARSSLSAPVTSDLCSKLFFRPADAVHAHVATKPAGLGKRPSSRGQAGRATTRHELPWATRRL